MDNSVKQYALSALEDAKKTIKSNNIVFDCVYDKKVSPVERTIYLKITYHPKRQPLPKLKDL